MRSQNQNESYPRDQVSGAECQRAPSGGGGGGRTLKETVRQERGAPEAIWGGTVSRRNE